MGEKRLKNRDLAHDVYTLKLINWSLALGVTGAVIGYMLAELYGTNHLVGFLAGGAIGGGGCYFFASKIVFGAADVARQIHSPDGTPPKREYSQAESLVARGKYEEAALAFEIHCAEYPEDPDPYFRVARIYSKNLARYEEAVVWFRRVRKDAKVTPSQDLVALQETIEILLHKIRDPRKAIPDLAALAQRHADTPAGQAAARELALMRELLADEHAGGAKFTEEFLARAVRKQGEPE